MKNLDIYFLSIALKHNRMWQVVTYRNRCQSWLRYTACWHQLLIEESQRAKKRVRD